MESIFRSREPTVPLRPLPSLYYYMSREPTVSYIYCSHLSKKIVLTRKYGGKEERRVPPVRYHRGRYGQVVVVVVVVGCVFDS